MLVTICKDSNMSDVLLTVIDLIHKRVCLVMFSSQKVVQFPRQRAGSRPVSGVSGLVVPAERLPAVEAAGRPRTPGPTGLPHSDPGGRLRARLRQDLRLARSDREQSPDRVRHKRETLPKISVVDSLIRK